MLHITSLMILIEWLQEIQQERLRLQTDHLAETGSLHGSGIKQDIAKASVLVVAQEVPHLLPFAASTLLK